MRKQETETESDRQCNRRRRKPAGGAKQAEEKNNFRGHSRRDGRGYPPRLSGLRGSALSEGLDCLVFGIEDFEDGQQLGHLQ